MSLSRVLPWVPLGLALAACESSSPMPAAAAGQPHAGEASPGATAPSSASPAVSGDPTAPPAKSAAGDEDSAPVDDAALAADVRSANSFSLKVLARTKKPTDNALVSGTSLRHALGTTYLGARGPTAREMATALSLDTDAKAAARLARAELAAWQDAAGEAELNIASRLWIDDGFTVAPDFTRAAERGFGAAPASVDYAKADDARKTINAWVAEKTKDKIPELLPQGSVDPRTQLVVTNAIWFKARWAFPFPKAATKDEAFKVEGKKSVTVPMMHLTDSFRVTTQPGVKILEMPYGGSQLSMLIVLPDDPGALAKVEASLGPDVLERWTDQLAPARVNVTLPRFTFRSGGVMNTTLQDLGMKTAFTDKADFGGIAEPRGGERLYVNQVFHQTYVAVDELGTEAAAATGATMRTTSMITGPVVEFKADHPFLFLVQDTKHGRLLFAGRVANPKG